MTPSLVWFRCDLRIADNPALTAAIRRGGPVVPVFIWSPEEEDHWRPGAASCWWLHQSLVSLDAHLRRLGSHLIVRRGTPTAGGSLGVLRSIISDTNAEAVFWNRRYEPAPSDRDGKVEAALRADGLMVESFNGSLLLDPGLIRTKAGNPYTVFAPFWKACLAAGEVEMPTPAPARIPAPPKWPDSLPLRSLDLELKTDRAAGLRAAWKPGEGNARRALDRIVSWAIALYRRDRDRPGRPGTSRLSPHLHFGEISARTLWRAVTTAVEEDIAQPYLRQIGWREFAHHLLVHFPRTPDEPLRGNFSSLPWRADPDALKAWKRGRTGYPFIDAAMRELWATGWMHNRARMAVGSFLAKDLLLPWQEGARWFWDTLVDADLANNTLGWQWVAGCGADAAPYVRVFNPVTQGEKFDPEGHYVRRWVPELARLPSRWIYRPSQAPAGTLRHAAVELDLTYPRPVVDHAEARARALAAFREVRTGR